jgi:2-dehydropantoate 2-reductase
MRMLVMGAGAMGSVVGGLMAQAGHAVTLVGRQGHMAAIAASGLKITGIWGDHHITTLETRTDLAGLDAGDFDFVLICVKSYDTAAAVEAIEPLLDAGTLVCAYQNGLGNAETIAGRAGWARTVGARAIFGAWLPEPGCAEVTVIANPTALGVYTEDAPADRVRALAQAMDAAGVPTVYTGEITTVLWSKVAYNCALNALSGLLDVPYGVLPETAHCRAIMHDIVHELYAVAEAMGVALKPATPAQYMDLLYDKLIPPTARHYASTREDLRQRRRTEIDALNGAIAHYGRQHGVPTPANTLITRLVHAREHALGIA